MGDFHGIVISNFPFEPNYLFKGRLMLIVFYSRGVLKLSYVSHSPSFHRDGLKAATREGRMQPAPACDNQGPYGWDEVQGGSSGFNPQVDHIFQNNGLF